MDEIKSRRSINYFDSSIVIDEKHIENILELAALTPSSLNLQPWKVLAVKTLEKKKILRKCAMDQPKVEEASAVLVIMANQNACEENIDAVLKSWVELGYMDVKTSVFYKTLPSKLYGEKDSLKRKLFAVKNASFFAMSIMYAAKSLGFETHPMDGFDEEMIKKEFNISSDYLIPVIIAVGKLAPNAKVLPRAWRAPVSKFVKHI